MLTQERLKELLHYNPETGLFTCLVWRGGTAVKGSIAGYDDNGYIKINIDGEVYYAHRLAYLYVKGNFPENDIDHVNTIRNDNRWCNLRNATRTQNNGNVDKRTTNTSGIKGVWWNKYHRKWTAEITIDKRKIHLGHFIAIKDAIIARHAADIKYFVEFKRIEQLSDVA